MTERFARIRFKRVVLWPIAALGATILVGMIPPRLGGGTTLTAAAYAFYLTFLLSALIACRAAGVDPLEVIGRQPAGARPWLKATALTPLLLLFSAFALLLTIQVGDAIVPGWNPERDEADILARLGRTQRILLALNITLLGPFAEEFVFRGLLLRRWLETRGFWPAILGSAAIFALLHPPSWIGAFTFGVVMGILYLWSGSLLLPVLAHVLNNAFVTGVLVLAESMPQTTPEEAQTLTTGSSWIWITASLLVIGSLIARLTVPMIRQIRSRAADG